MDIEQPVVNGTEGGGAGAYQASQMRICPQGGQQQDPKQQPQQTTVPVLVTGGMQHNMYSNRQNAMNYYQPRGSSHNPRMTAQPRPINVVYQAAHGGSMNNPIYMQQMVLPQNVTFNMQQPPRHQSHGAGTPNPQAANIAFPQSYYVPSAQQQLQNYPYAPTPYLQMPMRNQQAVPNSAQFSQQQQPQQLQVAQQTLSNPAGQSMVTLLPQNAPSGMPVSHQIQHNQFRPKKRPERALLITHPVTGEDVLKDLWEINEGGEERVSASNTPQPPVQEESIEKATVAAEFASKVAVAVSSDSPLVQSEAVANGPTSRSVSPPPEPPQPLKLPISEQIPTVSAKTNSPTVELHRHQPVTKPSPLAQPHYLPQQIHIPLNNPQPISQPITQPPYSPPSPSPPPQQPQVQAQPQTQPQLPPQRPLSPATKVDASRTQSTSPTRKNQQVAQVQNEKAKLKKEEMPAAKKDAPKVRSISPPTSTQPQTPVVTASTPLPQEASPKSEPVERQPSPSPQVQPFIEDTNGETDDAVKAQQRPKANKQKKKDLNRKGVEKEGTDMDAFQVADEHVETPEDPPEVEKDVADAIVAAKNEENNKVSANNNNNESPDESQVIESMTIERSEPQLQYHYKESQWSPINTEGKKVYDREFLMEVRNNPLSIKRPEKLANESLLRETPNVISSTRRLNSSSNSIGSLPKGDNMNSYIRSSSSQRGMSRQGGMRNSLPKPMGHGSMHKNMMKSGSSGYNMHGMYRDEPNLHKVANSWKPSRLINNTNLSEEELKTEVLLKTMRGILNKLTPQKFDRLLEKVNKLDINNEDRMKKVVDLVFEKAIDEPSFSTMYAQLCFALQLMKVQVVKEKVDEATPQSVGFRKVLLLKCQHEFEKTKEDELDIDARQKQIAETKDQDKRKELLLAFEEDERKIRIKSVGLVRFIGELFKKNMLTHNIMHQCITSLIEKTDEESLECLCKLLTTIGKDLESKSTGGEFNNYFATMKKLSHKSPDSKISSRIRFMLQDVIELRANKWIPRRDENKPKTIEQIQKDAEKETFMESFQSSMSSNMNRGNRNDDRRRTQKNQVSEDGWHNVNKTRSSNYTLESQKLMNMKSGLEPENLLGKPGQFNQWSMGAKRQNTENKNFTSANKFDILQSQEDRKLPLYGSSGRKGVTPSPSIEKERAIAGVKAMRGSGSGPNSRESSRSRYGSSPATSISKEEKVREPEPKPQEEMTEELDEQLSRSTRLVIDEYFSNKNSDEAYESIQDVFAATNRLKIFIEKSLSHVTENTNAEKRARFANLLVILIKDKKLLPKKDIIEGFSKIMDNEDLITDLPLMWQYLAQLLAPLIAQEALDFQDFKLASKQIAKENVSKLLVEIITFLIKDKGPCWISTQWESCHMNIKDFVPDNENIDKFITDKKLGFLTGSAEYPLQPDESLTCEEIEEKLLKFLKNDTNKAIDHTCDWIKANVSDKTKGTTLVKALTRASIKGSLVKEKFCGNAFEVNMRLIKKYVDNDEKYELACLYAAQHLLANEIVSPPTVIQEIFESLYTSGTISFEGFMKWKETKMSEENEVGKGVLLSVLSSFFVMLSENSNDTEEES